MSSPCPYCDNGEYVEMGTETCPTCCGTGKDLNCSWEDRICKDCGGGGKTNYCRAKTCPVCRGSGFIN